MRSTCSVTGHRHAAGPDELTIEDLARDVLAQLPGPVDVLAGHSLGSIVALTLAGLAPAYCGRLVIEDPPGLAGSLDLGEVAAGVEESVRVARADPAGTVAALLEENPVWSQPGRGELGPEPADPRRRSGGPTAADRPVGPPGAGRRRVPYPVQLLAATEDSALTDPDRSVLMGRLPADQVAVIASGHTIHRERPALWLHHVLRFADDYG